MSLHIGPGCCRATPAQVRARNRDCARRPQGFSALLSALDLTETPSELDSVLNATRRYAKSFTFVTVSNRTDAYHVKTSQEAWASSGAFPGKVECGFFCYYAAKHCVYDARTR